MRFCFESMADGFAAALFLRELDGDEAVANEEIKRLQSRLQSIRNKSASIRKLMIPALIQTGKVKTPRVTAYIRKSQSVVVDKGARLGEAYLTKRVTVTPNKVAIKSALADGIAVPGCRLEEHESVQIR